jgi:hypothetical protein
MIDLNFPQNISYINALSVLIVTFCLIVYRFIYPKRKIKFIILLLIIAIIPTLSIFRSGTYRTGDLTPHYIQLMSFYKNISEGILLPRWAGDLCGSFGCPIFIIEYILPYYFASFFHFVGFSFVTSMKLVLVTSFIASGITMYLWAKDEFGEIAGFVSAIFYLFVPYHLIDLHFRGSVGEVLSFVFIPLLFLFSKNLIELTKVRYFFIEAIIVFLIVLTHSSTTLISLPLVFGYGIVVWIRKKKKVWKELVFLFCSIIYGIMLSTFYWLPAMDGVKYTWWIYTTFGDFKPITEYLYSPILFGLLFQGHHGEYRLIIGYFHLLIILFAFIFLFKGKIKKTFRLLLIFLLCAFLILFFMLQSLSKPIWEHICLLHTFIVVWRLLVPIAFISSAIAGIVIMKIKNTKILILICYLLIVLTIPNWANRKMVPLTNTPFLHEAEIYTEYFEKGNPIFEQSMKIRDPLKFAIVSHPPAKPIEFLKGNGQFRQLKRNQTKHQYIIEATNEVVILENTNYFPGWKVFVNNNGLPINYKNRNNLGKITFNLKRGLYKVDVVFTDTPIRVLSQNISMISFLLGVIYLIFYKYKMLHD